MANNTDDKKKTPKTQKYIGPKYNDGIEIGGKVHRPAHVKPEDLDDYLKKNPKLKKYFG